MRRVPKKVVMVVGTRPEAIKIAPLCLEFRKHKDRFETQLWVTAQHREILDQVLDVFQLQPDLDFNLMKKDQSLSRLTCEILARLEIALASARPDLVIVQGDTTTAFASALAAFYARIPVAHVEAGLRTWNSSMPFPEEINRQIVTRLATLHFAPTEQARKNLMQEQVSSEFISVTGNTVIDALKFVSEKISHHPPAIPENVPDSIVSSGRRMVLITCHRRESFGERLESICQAVESLVSSFPDVDWVFPVHLNPAIRAATARIQKKPNLHLTEPLSYEQFVWLMSNSCFIMTDSGGIQEEAPYFGKPVLVMRDTSDRPEALNSKSSLLVGTRCNSIVTGASRLLTDNNALKAMSKRCSPFGDGRASKRIVDSLRKFL